MALSYPLSFPDVGITRIDMRLKRSVAVSQSPFSYQQQTHDFGGAIWEAEVSLPPLTYAQAREVEVFLLGLNGMSKTFTMGHPLHTATGSVYVDANSGNTPAIGNTTITLDGAAVDAGTYFSIDNRLYMLLEDKAQGSADGAKDIAPPLRTAPSHAAQIELSAPKGTWRLAANDIGYSTDVAGLYGFTFSCIEAL